MNIERSESASKDESSPAYLQGLSVSQRRRIHEKFEMALAWMDSEPPQLDRAALYLQQCIESDPAGAAYVHTYLNVLFQLKESEFNAAKLRKRGWWKRFVDSLSTPSIDRALANSDPTGALVSAIKLLRDNPLNLTVLLLAEKAASTLGLQDTRWCLLEYAHATGIDRFTVTERMLDAILDGGRFDKLTDLAKELSDEAKLPERWQQILMVCESHFGTLNAEVTKSCDPDDIEKAVSLCRELSNRGQISNAVNLAEQYAARHSHHVDLKEVVDELQIRLTQERLEVAIKLNEKKQLPRGVDLIEELEDEALRVELDIISRRVDLNNGDPDLKIRLVDLLMKAGNYWEAIKQIDSVNAVGPFTIQLQLRLARCRQHVHQFAPALAAYGNAISAFLDNRHGVDKEALLSAITNAVELATAMDRLDLVEQWEKAGETLEKVD